MRASLEAMGDSAWRVRLPAIPAPRALLEALRSLPGVVDAVVTEQHALVTFEPTSPPRAADVARTVRAAQTQALAVTRPRRHVVPVRYDGPDLDDLARRLGRSRAEIEALHAAGTYVVAMLGFQPGFAYLRGLDARLVTPRRASPRPRVPALAVWIAGPYTGIYPFFSPGGWNLVGTAIGFSPFEATSGAALALGDEVRFVREVP